MQLAPGEIGDVDRRRRLEHRELAQTLGRERAGERVVDLARGVEAKRRYERLLLLHGVALDQLAQAMGALAPRAGARPRADQRGQRALLREVGGAGLRDQALERHHAAEPAEHDVLGLGVRTQTEPDSIERRSQLRNRRIWI